MTPYPLHRSETSTKIMITLFLLFMVASFSVAFLNVYDKVGLMSKGVVLRYGPDNPAPTNANEPTNEPALPANVNNEPALPSLESEPLVARINTFGALIDLTHPHVFEMPLVLLVLCHFLMRTRLASWAKTATYFLSFGGVAGMLSTPWLVRYLSVKFAPLLLVSALFLMIAAIMLIVVPIFDMWLPARKKGDSISQSRKENKSTKKEVDAQYAMD